MTSTPAQARGSEVVASFKLKKGLDIPISGAPKQTIESALPVKKVAVLGCDFFGLKPTMKIAEGDRVVAGQVLFEDKKNPGVVFTAPASGTCVEINRGHKRVLQSVVIEKEGSECQDFESYLKKSAADYTAEEVRAFLLESGAWIGFRTRPYSKVPAVNASPERIFVSAMDTNPLAPRADLVIEQYPDSFKEGLEAISKLAPVFLCQTPGDSVPSVDGVSVAEFSGPHPAGLPGTHMHFLSPVSSQRTHWTLGYQDVIAIGYLFKTGQPWLERIVSLAGPQVKKPRLMQVPLGASIQELTANELETGESRIISGSILSGRKSFGPFAYLGYYHVQVSVLREGTERGLFEYLWAGKNKHSVLGVFLSKLNPKLSLPLTTSTQGSERAMVPVGSYEKVVPLDVLPTQLLRALIVGDLESAEALGSLELDEEDLSLCTYVCPGKYEYGPMLRSHLEEMEREG